MTIFSTTCYHMTKVQYDAEVTGWHSSPFHPPMRTIRCSKVGLELWVLTQITFRYVYNAQHTIHRMLENKDGEMGEIILTFSWTFRWKSVRWKQKNGVMKNKRCSSRMWGREDTNKKYREMTDTQLDGMKSKSLRFLITDRGWCQLSPHQCLTHTHTHICS